MSTSRRGECLMGERRMCGEVRGTMRTIGLLLAALAAPAAAVAQSCPPALTPDQATGPIADVRYLADDRLEGRAVGSDGGMCATAYIAARFDAMGLQPASPR